MLRSRHLPMGNGAASTDTLRHPYALVNQFAFVPLGDGVSGLRDSLPGVLGLRIGDRSARRRLEERLEGAWRRPF